MHARKSLFLIGKSKIPTRKWLFPMRKSEMHARKSLFLIRKSKIPVREMTFPDEEKRNAREEITFPDQEKPNPNETADYSRCGAGNPPLDNQRSIITTDIGLTHHGTGRPK